MYQRFFQSVDLLDRPLINPDVRGSILRLPTKKSINSPAPLLVFITLFIIFPQIQGEQSCNLTGWKLLHILEFPSDGS